MLSYLQYHSNTISKKELLSKVYFLKYNTLPTITSITLNINIFNKNKIFLLPTIFSIETLTNSQAKTTKTRTNNISLKIRKNTIIGCTIQLKKTKKNLFLQNLIFFILPLLGPLPFKLTQHTYSFQIFNLLMFREFELYFNLFNRINKLTVLLHFNTNNKDSIKILLTSLKFIFK